MDYQEFLKQKVIKNENFGFEFDRNKLNEKLFDFEKDIIIWSLKKGKSAIFSECGTGKTFMQLEWARIINEKENKPVLILAPLAVSEQTVEEGKKFNFIVNICENNNDIINGINITNYEKIEKFNLQDFIGIVLDESSILKCFTSKYKNLIIEKTQNTKYKLACTATPAPNDFMELGNHSEFLNILKRREMLANYFINDTKTTQKWRLKKAAIKQFWKWVSTWAVMLTKPSDLGYENKDFILPKLNYIEHIVKLNKKPENSLFHLQVGGLQERQQARKESIEERTDYAAKIANEINEPCIIWCGLNSESELLKNKINNSVEIKGQNTNEFKKQAMKDFTNLKIEKLITKPKISGFGMNWQHCNKMIFVGLNDSFEQFYQAVRRCWRFGQKKEVYVHIIVSEKEGTIIENIKRKERDFKTMVNYMVENMKEFNETEVRQKTEIKEEYKSKKIETKNYTLINGDCIEEMKKIENESWHFSIFSPPFKELYVYSDNIRDLSNCKDEKTFWIQFDFFVKELFRVIKQGRLVAIHTMDLTTNINRDGFLSVIDFGGQIIKKMQENNFIFHAPITIPKQNPLVEAIRTHNIQLLYNQFCKDSSISRPALPDRLLVFRKPGINKEPIKRKYDVNNKEMQNRWCELANPIWGNIKQNDTLNKNQSKDEQTEKHITCLQLEVYRRAIELWTNEGDTVGEPYAGIGSGVFESVKMKRKGIGIELKESYYNQAVKNLKELETEKEIEEVKLF